MAIHSDPSSSSATLPTPPIPPPPSSDLPPHSPFQPLMTPPPHPPLTPLPPPFTTFPPYNSNIPPPYFGSQIPPPIFLSPSPNFDPITPITSPTPIKLNQTNFLTWKAQILPLINGYNLMKFLNQPPPNPTRQTADGQLELNQEYLPWNIHDQLLLGWLRASLSESIQAHVVSYTTSASLWSTLQQQFSVNSRARLIDLKRQLQSASKGSSSCGDYLQQLRRIADELSFIGSPPSDDDLILSLLNGLGPEFNAFVAAITATSHHDTLTFSNLHGMLLSHEALLKGQLALTSSSPSAFLAGSNNGSFRPGNSYQRPRHPPPRPNGSNFTQKRPVSQPSRPTGALPNPPIPPGRPPAPNTATGQPLQPIAAPPPRQCQICKKFGHSAKFCSGVMSLIQLISRGPRRMWHNLPATTTPVNGFSTQARLIT